MGKIDDWKYLYNERPDAYERLVRYEDYHGALLTVLNHIHPIQGQRVIEFGAGTGRVTSLLAPLAAALWSCDLTPAMIRMAQKYLRSWGRDNWMLSIADNRAMPFPDSYADITIEGWSFLQMMVWQMETWQREVSAAVDEMLRLLRPGGTAIMIETQGTGVKTPQIPDHFQMMYDYLENERGFRATWMRTDYLFPSLRAAQEAVSPFFGEIMLDNLMESDAGLILPECTGIWWRQKSGD
jgi:ubiquinone/menaquinone biosynthesis C-methylase UbiE